MAAPKLTPPQKSLRASLKAIVAQSKKSASAAGMQLGTLLRTPQMPRPYAVWLVTAHYKELQIIFTALVALASAHGWKLFTSCMNQCAQFDIGLDFRDKLPDGEAHVHFLRSMVKFRWNTEAAATLLQGYHAEIGGRITAQNWGNMAVYTLRMVPAEKGADFFGFFPDLDKCFASCVEEVGTGTNMHAVVVTLEEGFTGQMARLGGSSAKADALAGVASLNFGNHPLDEEK